MNSSEILFKNPLLPEEYEERLKPREEDIRGVYFRDHTAIVHSLPFRRMKHKAQVFFSPNNDHVCTRIEHSLHVATIAGTIARSLQLNGELAYAIGLAHDLGHAPFGHAGESVLREKTQERDGFIHEIHGLRVVDILGNRGQTLNLSYGVRDGIVCHCGEKTDQTITPRPEKIDLSTIKTRDFQPCSYEGCVARISDRIAYLGRDLEDAIDGGFVKREDVPREISDALGDTNGHIIDTLVCDVIQESREKKTIAMSDRYFGIVLRLHEFSRDRIYKHSAIERYRLHCERIIDTLFDYLMDLMGSQGWDISWYERSAVSLDQRFGRYLKNMREVYQEQRTPPMVVVRDYVAGMTDGYALRCMREISLPDELNFDVPMKVPTRS